MQFAFFCGTIVIFQSTSPYAGDDMYNVTFTAETTHFNPRPPTRGTTQVNRETVTPWAFQSTSPYAGDDKDLRQTIRSNIYFNPRPPTRGTTSFFTSFREIWDISIHVPLRGGRPEYKRIVGGKVYISIHVPLRGGRQQNCTKSLGDSVACLQQLLPSG